MNSGILVGKVLKEGKPVKGAEVRIQYVYSSLGNIFLYQVENGITDSDGEFLITLEWHVSEFAEDLSLISIVLVVLKHEQVSSTRMNTTLGRTVINGHLTIDVKEYMEIAFPILDKIERDGNSNFSFLDLQSMRKILRKSSWKKSSE